MSVYLINSPMRQARYLTPSPSKEMGKDIKVSNVSSKMRFLMGTGKNYGAVKMGLFLLLLTPTSLAKKWAHVEAHK